MSKNSNYTYFPLVMSNGIIFRGAAGQKRTELWHKRKLGESLWLKNLNKNTLVLLLYLTRVYILKI
jgi:hypothetical protein